MTLAIETRDLCVEYPGPSGPVNALQDLTLKVEPGTVFGFLGPNGAGKTTTMHVLLGFVPPTSGKARLFDQDVRKAIARERIGYLAEHPDTYRFLTGRELLRMTGRLFLVPRSRLDQRVDEVLTMVTLQDAADRKTATYSRGMLQRICLAQALINDPDLLILDEPTGGLDPVARMDVRGIIETLRRRGKTVFFSSHELSEVELVCDHIAIVAHGRVLAEGKADDLVPPGQSLETYFLDAVGAGRKAE